MSGSAITTRKRCGVICVSWPGASTDPEGVMSDTPDAGETVEITPDPRLILTFRNPRMAWRSRKGELIDNAFDAGANHINFHYGRKRITVTDDGDGCEHILSMFKFGEQRPQEK